MHNMINNNKFNACVNRAEILKKTALLPIICLALVAFSPAASAQAGDSVEAITKPSSDVKLAFVRPGLVAEILVKEGQPVKAGDLLVRQDDQAEIAQLEQARATAEEEVRVQASAAQLEQKKVDLARLEEAIKKGASTELEVQHARLDVKIAELQMKLEQFQHSQDKRKYDEMKFQVDRMQIKSPIDGKVEELFIKQGESVDGLVKVIRVVNVDKLWVDVQIPMEQTRVINTAFSAGQSQQVDVVFPDSSLTDGQTVASRTTTLKGKVVHIAAVADGASLTQMVRVEVANTSGRPAGEHVQVKFNNSEPASRPAVISQNQ